MRRRAALALAAICLAACSDRNDVIRLRNGFEPPGAAVIDAEGLRRFLVEHHVPETHVECVTVKAFEQPPPPVTVPDSLIPRHKFDENRLNELATACGVDVTKLWKYPTWRD